MYSRSSRAGLVLLLGPSCFHGLENEAQALLDAVLFEKGRSLDGGVGSWPRLRDVELPHPRVSRRRWQGTAHLAAEDGWAKLDDIACGSDVAGAPGHVCPVFFG